MSLTDAAPVHERVHWQSVLEALDEVVLLLNSRYVVTYASPSIRPRLGYAPQTVTGRALGDLVHPDDLRTALRHLAEVGLGGAVRHTMRVRRAEDGYVLLDWSLTRTIDDQGGDLLVLSGRDGATRLTLEERLASVDQRQARTAAGLTPREHEVLERLADGRDATQIARELELSVYSVRGHIKSLMRKLDVHSQLQAVVVGARRGIVDVVGERRVPAVPPTGRDDADGSPG